LIRQKEYNEAFRNILEEENVSIHALVRTMGFSGICVKKLELSIIESLIT
jgi:hypothetical protein